MIRRFALVFLVACLVGVATSCAERREIKTLVQGFIANTEESTRSFEYQLSQEKKEFVVRGEVEDSLRTQASLSVDGDQLLEQVIDDDAMSVRIVDPLKLPSVVSGAIPASRVVLDTLTAGKWVTDPSGAPALVTERGLTPGRDVMQDATQVLRYVRLAMDQAQEVKEWREEDLEPAYKPSEENFPKGNDEAGERRFDLVRPAVPRPSALGVATNPPTTAMFRRMAIYVRKGKVVKVLEEIDIDGHPDFLDARRDNRKRMLEYLAQTKALEGTRKIHQRKMSIDFSDFGKSIEIRQPSDTLRAGLEGVLDSAVMVFSDLPQAPPAPTNQQTGEQPAPQPGEQPAPQPTS